MAAQLTTPLDGFFQNAAEHSGPSNVNRNGSMNFELFRLASFKNWPRWAPVQPNQLAKAGFFYTGEHDKTECFICHRNVSQWHERDRPHYRHRQINADCPFVKGEQTSNIPLPCPAATEDSPDQPMQAAGVGNMQSSNTTAAAASDSAYHSNPVPRSILLPDYQVESARLETFRNWPTSAYVGPEELAAAGFVYLGSMDRVQCAFCKGILKNWAPGDRAFSEHQKHYPHCSFVRNPEAAPLSIPAPASARSPAAAAMRNQNQPTFAGSLNELGVETDLPKHHAFAIEATRLASFKNWPASTKQQPPELARAGFFYIGQADSVKCFWCDGGLRNWDANDDPWVEHARWFPKCGHVKRSKGTRFIESVKSTKKQTPAAPQQQQVYRELGEQEVSGHMGSSIVKKVLEMGFEREFVRDVVEYKLKTSSDVFEHSEELLEMCLQFRESPPADFPIPPHDEATTTGAGAAAATAAPVEPPNLEEIAQATTIKREKKPAQGGNGNAVECKICMDAEVNVVFLPCGHLVCCSKCAPALKNCPICRGLIRGTVNAILS